MNGLIYAGFGVVFTIIGFAIRDDVYENLDILIKARLDDHFAGGGTRNADRVRKEISRRLYAKAFIFLLAVIFFIVSLLTLVVSN